MAQARMIKAIRENSISADRRDAIDLGQEPPLDPSGASTHLINRHAVSFRWLGASVLAAVTGTFLIGAAIQISLDSDTISVDLPELARPANTSNEQGPVSARKGDKLVKAEPASGARQAFKAPMTLRSLDREVIKVRPFVKISSNLALTSGVYASNIPPFNPLSLFADTGSSPDRYVDAAPEVSDADVSVVKLDLGTIVIDEKAPGLSEDEVIAQIDEERRVTAEAGRRPVLPIPPQLMLSRTLRQPLDGLGGATSFTSPVETAFSALEVRVAPENVSVLTKSAAVAQAPIVEERSVQLKKGETLDQSLKSQGATADQIKSVIAALGGRARINALQEGQALRVLIAPGPQTGSPRQIVRVALVDESTIQSIAAINDKGEFVAVAPPVIETASAGKTSGNDDEEEDTPSSSSGVTLYESLFETGMKHDLPRGMIDELVRIFAYDMDFQRRVAGGDSFEVFLTEDEDGGERGELLYASLSIGGETRKVFRFVSPEDGLIDYFDQDGKSLKKFLLRKPIAEGDMRSGFGYRRHPILGYAKMHTGVDWSNRIGTPIFASGNGTILMAAWDSGYGRRVEIQHANGYTTTYSHMSRFANNIQPGVKVRQGQVIGYLGNTGLSTGPHLHYEVLVNGHFVNPLKIKVPRGRELDGRALAEFMRQRTQVEGIMQKGAAPRFAQRDVR
jgi:murein DD-endopeptidase MepM/ murein hydrolase activator NlpD